MRAPTTPGTLHWPHLAVRPQVLGHTSARHRPAALIARGAAIGGVPRKSRPFQLLAAFHAAHTRVPTRREMSLQLPPWQKLLAAVVRALDKRVEALSAVLLQAGAEAEEGAARRFAGKHASKQPIMLLCRNRGVATVRPAARGHVLW